VKPRNTVKQGGLAGTIGTDEADEFIPLNFKRNIVVGPETPEILDQVMDFKKCH
jgi:hypothetical protein